MSSLDACTCFYFQKIAMTTLAPFISQSTWQHKNRMSIIKPSTTIFISTIITTLLVISLSPSKIFSDPYLKSEILCLSYKFHKPGPIHCEASSPSFTHKASCQPRWCLHIPQNIFYLKCPPWPIKKVPLSEGSSSYLMQKRSLSSERHSYY